MKLKINNLAKISSATLDFDGLTVIIGDNDSGKSTVGKVLFTLFHSMSAASGKVAAARRDYIFKHNGFVRLRRYFPMKLVLGEREPSREEIRQMMRNIRNEEVHSHRLGLVYAFDSVLPMFADESSIEKLADSFYERVLQARKLTDETLAFDVLRDDLNGVFNGQALPNFGQDFGPSCVELVVKGRKVSVTLDGPDAGLRSETSLLHDAWFVGSPLILNSVAERRSPSVHELAHSDLVSAIRKSGMPNVVTKRIVRAELEPIYRLLDRRFSANFVSTKEFPLGVVIEGMAKPLNAANLSMGLKTFALLTLMLDCDILKKEDVLILDEPENHLHPAWQVAFAEIVVVLQKIFRLTILLTTHSPYFLEAIELYSRKYCGYLQQANPLKVYQPRQVDSLGRIGFDDVTSDLSAMYRKFSEPLRGLDWLRNEVSDGERAEGE